MNSTRELYQAIRTRLLDFTPKSGDTLRTRLGGGTSARLYTEQAPDTTVYPYAVLSIKSERQSPEYSGIRKEGELEIQVFDRPRSQQWRAEGIADVIEQAAFQWVKGDNGLLFTQHARRVRMPPAPDPMDRELVQIVVFVPVVVWPVMLTQYLAT